MKSWSVKDIKLKQYPHFDAPISIENIEELLSCKESIARHGFYPFLYFEEKFQPFRKSGKDKKIRPIRYAARADSYIFSKYRAILSQKYESKLIAANLENSIIAYRNIPKKGTTGGKSNIEFAKDAFDTIKKFKNCLVVTADISQYFDTIDHQNLKIVWQNLLGVERLPEDHYSVFRAITKYSDVDYKTLCKELGFFGDKKTKWGSREGYLVNQKEIPKKICTNGKFKKIKEKYKAEGKKLIRQNLNEYGIPQGAPLSDVLANAYLFDFDVKVLEFVNDHNGIYYRYSDDILIIIPTLDVSLQETCENFLSEEIKKTGNKIRIKKEKCASLLYQSEGEDNLSFTPLSPKTKQTNDPDKKYKMGNGLEYLGFRFDGKYVFLRDKTLSRFYRKIKRSAWAEAYSVVSRYPNRSSAELIKNYNYEAFYKRFGKVESFAIIQRHNNQRYRTWTFYTYVKRAIKCFGDDEQKFRRQIRKFRTIARDELKSKIRRVKNMKVK